MMPLQPIDFASPGGIEKDKNQRQQENLKSNKPTSPRSETYCHRGIILCLLQTFATSQPPFFLISDCLLKNRLLTFCRNSGAQRK
jgi:hypothetical protein